MNTNTSRNASVVGLVLKCFLAVVLARIILTAVCYFGLIAAIALDGTSYNYEEDRCEGYYHSGNYADLCEYLNRFNLTGEKYEIYHEAVEGAVLKSQYLQWSAAAEQGMDGAGQKAERILMELQALADNCQYEENREIFTGFLLELQ